MGNAGLNREPCLQFRSKHHRTPYHHSSLHTDFPYHSTARPTQPNQIWYPCGSFKGDEKSAALAQSYASNGFLASLSKKQLDAGISGSLYKDLPKLEESIFRGYPQLRKEKKNLEYGYKLNYPGLSKEQEKIMVVEVKDQKGGILGGLQNLFGGN